MLKVKSEYIKVFIISEFLKYIFFSCKDSPKWIPISHEEQNLLIYFYNKRRMKDTLFFL